MTRRLADGTVGAARADVVRPCFDRAALRPGVLHFGPGAFHRAHQTVYFDDLAACDSGWGITGVSLTSTAIRDALSPQDGLFTLVTRGAPSEVRVIGVLKKVLVASEQHAAVLRHMIAPDLRAITITVTEKGYLLDADGELDFGHATIQADLAAPDRPRSLTGWLVEGLRQRRAAGLAPPVILSCDNLDDNGRKLHRAVAAHARRLDPALADWVEGEVRFPRTMVDSITPATDAALREEVAARLGLLDAWPVQREPYRRWVIEDAGVPCLTPLADVGAVLTGDVAGHAEAKLRILNAVHSALAYLGLLSGHETVAEAMADAELARLCRAMAMEDIVPALHVPSLNLPVYADDILKRLANRALAHRLDQIAADGSRKLPVRLYPTMRAALAAGRPLDRPAMALAGWMRLIVQRTRAGGVIDDPAAAELAQVGAACTGRPSDDVAHFCAAGFFPGDLVAEPRFVAALESAYGALAQRSSLSRSSMALPASRTAPLP